MSEPTPFPERKLIENEMVFRRFNEGVQDSLSTLKKIAKEDGQEHLVKDTNLTMHFYCECADEDCRERIIITSSYYDRIHKNRKRFIVKKNHEVVSVEKVVGRETDYNIVEKYNILTKEPASLNRTDLENN